MGPRFSYSSIGFSPIEGDVVSVFAAYFDESGTHSDKFLVVAGLTAEVDRWAEFAVRWNSALAQWQLPHLHMKDFKQKKNRAFSHMAPRDKANLLEVLTGIIADTALLGSWAMTSPFQYDRLTTPEFRSQFYTSFACCAVGAAVISVHGVRTLRPGNHRVGIFLERGHKNIGQALDGIEFHKDELEEVVLDSELGVPHITLPDHGTHVRPVDDPLRKNTVKIGAIGTGSRSEMPPLQAADLLAYAVYTAVLDPRSKFGIPILNDLYKRIPLYMVDNNEERIIGMVEGVTAAEKAYRERQKDLHVFSKETRKLGVSVHRVRDFLVLRGPTDQLQIAGEQLKQLAGGKGRNS